MLALDSTIGCIEASEPDVLDMYCSAPIMTALVPDALPESCEAYVCAIRKKASVHIYVALVADNKRIFVYTPSGGPEREEHYHQTLEEALSFSKDLGFAPERLNLNYSPAMREVVVRNIKILRPPGSKMHAQLGKSVANAPATSGTKKSGTTRKNPSPAASTSPVVASPVAAAVASAVPAVTASATRPPAPLPAAAVEKPVTAAAPTVLKVATAAAQPSSVSELAGLKGALSRMTEDNGAIRKQASEELDSLRKDLERALSDQERDREQLTAVRAELLESQKVREKTEAVAVSTLKENLAALCANRDALAVKVQELSAGQSASAAELAAVRAERSRLSAEKGALAQRLEAIEASSPDLALLQRDVAALKGALDEANRVNLESAAASARQTEELSRAREEIARLIMERDSTQQRLDQLAVASEQAASETEARRGELAMLATQREAALHHLKKVQRETSTWATEMQGLREEIAALCSEREAALAGAGRLQQESSTRVAEVHVLRSEMATLGAERKEALLKVGRLQRESSTREAEVQLLRGEIARLSTERGDALLRAQRLEQEIKQAKQSEIQPEPAEDGPQRPEIMASSGDADSWLTVEEVTVTGKPNGVASGEVGAKWQEPAQLAPAKRKAPETSWYETDEEKPGPLPDFSPGDDDFFPAADEPEGCPGRFTLQANLTAIEYGAPADLVELQQSINQAYLSPEGKEQANCQGYICSLKTADGAMRVVAAICVVQSGRTLVYLPEVQPKDQGDYASAVTGAVNFLEGVGFMMETLRLGSGAQHDQAVLGCKVLRRMDQE